MCRSTTWICDRALCSALNSLEWCGAGRRGDPFAIVVEAGEEADGADDGIGGDFDVLSLFDDVAEGEAQAAIALTEEIGGVGVAVDGAAVDLVGFGDGVDLSPVQKFLVDEFTFGMAAD
ncbi:MAG: hypothetical protein ACRD5K_03410 [Candidatus Acidiferrales bacterium]